jgi:hypothetical protein
MVTISVMEFSGLLGPIWRITSDFCRSISRMGVIVKVLDRIDGRCFMGLGLRGRFA